MIKRTKALLLLKSCLILSVFSLELRAVEFPPINSFLAKSIYPMGHGDPAQQDALLTPGPKNPGAVVPPELIEYAPSGPAQFGAYTSGQYPDGRRVFWVNGLDRIVKIDFETFEILSTHWFDGIKRWSEADADAAIAYFNQENQGLRPTWRAFREATKLKELAGVYTVLDKNNTYFIADKNGTITAYGDQDPTDPSSEIIALRSFSLPSEVTGYTVGMNITYDGWLLVPTEHGYLVAISRDFKDSFVVRLEESDGAEDKATRPTGFGWVRNSIAIDKDGGIYAVSQDHMHKVIWTGAGFTKDAKAGAWTVPYSNSWGHGSGATPSLMGFGPEDQFVVITDGEDLMNVVLFWRNEIPSDWTGLPELPRRVAGSQPANMGNPNLTNIQSEQSVIVAGYGALVVNNEPRNIPWWLPTRAKTLLISYLGSSPQHQPFGVQKFSWDPRSRMFKQAWVNRSVSSPSCVPIVSHQSGKVYLIGARKNQWTLEALDWQSGNSVFHSQIGNQRYNPFFSGTILDERGRIHYGSPWGRVRLNLPTEIVKPITQLSSQSEV